MKKCNSPEIMNLSLKKKLQLYPEIDVHIGRGTLKRSADVEVTSRSGRQLYLNTSTAENDYSGKESIMQEQGMWEIGKQLMPRPTVICKMPSTK